MADQGTPLTSSGLYRKSSAPSRRLPWGRHPGTVPAPRGGTPKGDLRAAVLLGSLPPPRVGSESSPGTQGAPVELSSKDPVEDGVWYSLCTSCFMRNGASVRGEGPSGPDRVLLPS